MKIKVTVMRALSMALMLFSAGAMADPSVVIETPLEGESIGFVSVLDGFTLPLQIGASDEDLNNPDGFAVKVESGGHTLYDKPDILFRKNTPTALEINEGYSYDPKNLYQTATITVTTPDGRVTTSTFVFGVLPYGGVLVHDLDEIHAAIDKAKEWENYPLVLIKTNSIPLVSGDAIALPTPDEYVNVYFGGLNPAEDLFDVSAIVPKFGTPYDVVTNFATNNFVEMRWVWDEEAEEDVQVPNILTTIDEQLAQFAETNGVSKIVYDDERRTISLIARGESGDFPWILDAATNVTAWVDAESSNLVVDNGLPEEMHEIDLAALTNNFALYGYTPAVPLNAVVRVVEEGTPSCKAPAGWVGANGGRYTTLADALAAGETAVLPGYQVSYDGNGAAGVMSNDVFAVNGEVSLTANAYSALGYTFAGWTTSVNTNIYTDGQVGTNFVDVSETLALTAKWTQSANAVTATTFVELTNMLAQAGGQSATLPVAISFSRGVAIPEGAAVTLPDPLGGLTELSYVDGETRLWREDGTLYGDPLRGDVPVDALAVMNLTKAGTNDAFKAVKAGASGTNEVCDVVMLLGDDGVQYDSVEAVLAADPRPATVRLFDVVGYWVSYDGNGAAGEMSTDMFIPSVPTNLTENAFTAVGYTFAGWMTNAAEEVAYADGAAGTDFVEAGETLALTAKWTETGVAAATFGVLTNALVTATNQAASLPVAITLTGAVPVPQDGVVTVYEGPAITFAGEGVFDVSGIVPQFGAPVVVGEGLADDSVLALFDARGVSKPVFGAGTVSLVARGETEDFPWILDAQTNVTAWMEPSLTNLAAVVVGNGPAADAEIDLVALTNMVARYGYKPAVTPLNAVVKIVDAGETSYRIPTGWIGATGTHETLEAALAAGETAVVPNFATGEIPAVVAENGSGSDGFVYTAVVANEPGEVDNAIRAVAAEGLLALATNELANVRLVVTAESAADVAAEEAKIAAALTNDVADVAGLAVDYVDLSVFFDDEPQAMLSGTVGICVPWTVNPQRDYAVARLHDGAAEKLPIGAENAVEGEFVEFAADGLVIHARKFSLYAIGEITPFATVTVPAGLEGFSYVVSNLTAGVEIAADSALDGGVTYKLPVGAKVSVVCVPEEGYVIDGEPAYVIDPVTRETTLADVALPVAREDERLYPTGDGGRFVPATKSVETFNGALFGESGVEGLITLKLTKPNRRTGLFNVRATVKTLVDKASYSFQAKKVAAPEEGVLTVELAGRSKKELGHRLVVTLDGDSLTGTFDDFAIDGARDVFGIRNHPKRAALAPLVGTWTGVFAGEDGKTFGAAFSVKILKSARASVKVIGVDGRTMVCSSKVEIGADGRGMVPVTVSRKSDGVRTSIGFRILFRKTADGVEAKAVNVAPVRQWSRTTGVASIRELAFVRAETLTVTPKAFRTSYVPKLAPTYDEVLGTALRESPKLDTSGRIAGTVAWKVGCPDARGREQVKSVRGRIAGIMVGDVGIGTVTVKLPTGEKVNIGIEFLKE